jgi:hypothetical protein
MTLHPLLQSKLSTRNPISSGAGGLGKLGKGTKNGAGGSPRKPRTGTTLRWEALLPYVLGAIHSWELPT